MQLIVLSSSVNSRGSRTSSHIRQSTGRCWTKVCDHSTPFCFFSQSCILTCTIIGWRFAKPDEKIVGDNVTPDPVHEGFIHLRDIYFKVDPEYKGRFTVPTLYDVKQGRIVNNEVMTFLMF